MPGTPIKMRCWRSKARTCRQHIKLAIRFQSANLSQLQKSFLIVEKFTIASKSFREAM
jgi:hypothetical protein